MTLPSKGLVHLYVRFTFSPEHGLRHFSSHSSIEPTAQILISVTSNSQISIYS